MSAYPRRRAALWTGQNFITSRKVIERMLARTTLSAADHVIEIGPGKGHITRALLERCRQVTAIELDGTLYERLRCKFRDKENLRLCRQDFLTWRLPAFGDYKIFANIPFNRTTAIIRRITGCPNPPLEAWLVMEKGAAKRFIGKPRESVMSLLIKPRFHMEMVYYLRRTDFHPMPSVDTVVLHLKRKDPPDIDRRQWRDYQRFVTEGMSRGVREMSCLGSRCQRARALTVAGIENDTTPGTILYVQWLCLFRCRTH